MAFYLGGFTSGLFGGAKDVMSIANEWEGLKQKRMETKRQQSLMDAGDQVKSALKADQGTEKATPAGSTTSATTTPEKYTEPDFSSLPAPKFMSDKVNKEALPLLPKASPDNPSEGKARLSPTTPKSALAATSDASAERVPFASPEGLIKQGIGAAARLGYGAHQALVGGGAQAAPAAEAPVPSAPTYLPPGSPGQPGSTWAIPPAAASAPGPQSALPAGTPNLASNQIGLGSRILSALGEGYNRSNLGQPYTPEEIARMSRGEAAATLAGAIPGSFLKNLSTLEQPYIAPALREETRKRMYEGKQDWGVPEA